MYKQVENRMLIDSEWNDQPEKYTTCDSCGEDINLGDYFYQIGNLNICEDCIDKYKKMARK